MEFELIPAGPRERPWLDELRRSVYAVLFDVTFGGWDEGRHRRHCDACWDRGNISIVELGGERVGMIQIIDEPDAIEIGEIQIVPAEQGRGIGTRLLRVVLASGVTSQRSVVLSVGLKNVRARELYSRLGFTLTGEDGTHAHMLWRR